MKRKKVGKILMIIVVVFALLIGCGFAYLYTNGMSGMSNTTQAKDGQIKIACVGDSVTYGHGISGWPGNSYPALLQELLGEGYHVNNYGVSMHALQDTSDYPYTSVKYYQESLDYDADIVVFMLGTNDSKPVNWIDAASFREDLITMLERYADAEIYLCTPAASFFLNGQTEGVTEHDIQPLIVEEIAQIIRAVAEEKGYSLIDIHTLTEGHSEWFAKDGVHPDNNGAAAIAQEIYTVLTKEK